MNQILAILELKNIISNDEAERMAAAFAEGIRPSRYSDALDQVKNLTDPDEEK